MRFPSAEAVKEFARKAAITTYRRYVELGHDLNIFCTQGAREDWQRGFDNAGPRSYETQDVVDYCTMYQRGRAVAELLESMKQGENNATDGGVA